MNLTKDTRTVVVHEDIQCRSDQIFQVKIHLSGITPSVNGTLFRIWSIRRDKLNTHLYATILSPHASPEDIAAVVRRGDSTTSIIIIKSPTKAR